MEKKRELVFFVGVAIILSAANVFSFYYSIKPEISGMSVGMAAAEIPRLIALSPATIVLIAVFVLAVLLVVFAWIIYLKRKKEDKARVIYDNIRKKMKRGETEFDMLYSLLKENKKLKIQEISKILNISPEKALEWSKLLENHNLALISYPAFSEPEVEAVT
ncbi:MAG TPA: hypothetical protein VJA86_00755 [Candidatus Nanoarchaeia archaeon]|nr:hypothetical protein [Candidatus Nanoarchaeia archaeon]